MAKRRYRKMTHTIREKKYIVLMKKTCQRHFIYQDLFSLFDLLCIIFLRRGFKRFLNAVIIASIFPFAIIAVIHFIGKSIENAHRIAIIGKPSKQTDGKITLSSR